MNKMYKITDGYLGTFLETGEWYEDDANAIEVEVGDVTIDELTELIGKDFEGANYHDFTMAGELLVSSMRRCFIDDDDIKMVLFDLVTNSKSGLILLEY